MPNYSEEEEIQLRGEGVHEILSYVPSKVIRYGNAVILAIIALLLIGSWFIKYPEIINSATVLSGQSPTVQHVAQSAGKLTLWVKNGERVHKGQYLAFLENAAHVPDVRSLKEMLKQQELELEQGAASVVLDLEKPRLLGELQNDYSNLKLQYQTYRSFIQDDFYPRKITALAKQYADYLNLNQQIGSQRGLQRRDLDLAQKKYERDKKLFDARVISQAELDRSEADYLQKEFAFKNAEINVTNNNIQLKEYEKAMLDVEQQYKDLLRERTLALTEGFKKMQSAIASWEQRYVVIASVDGKVSFFTYFSDNQFVKAGDEILSVVPVSNALLARCYVPSFGSGKIKKGQRVNIKLDGYPYKEFGMLEGRVEQISLTPRNNMYLVQVSLSNGLVTSYGKKLEIQNEMSGSAEIITADLRLLERLFHQLRSVINK